MVELVRAGRTPTELAREFEQSGPPPDNAPYSLSMTRLWVSPLAGSLVS